MWLGARPPLWIMTLITTLTDKFENSSAKRNPVQSLDARGRILVVDDERVNRAMLAGLLTKHDYVAMEARNGLQALDILQEDSIDLVLLDIVMPDMGGMELLGRIRQLKHGSDLPIVMVTANDQRDQILAAFEHGANDYVTKPIDVDLTLARVDTQLRIRHGQVALRNSEERYALAARGANDGLWDWDFETQVVYYSPRWKEMLGIAVNEVVESLEDWVTRIHAEDKVRVENELAAHLNGDTEHFEAEARMRHEDGNFRWMLCRGLAVRGDDGGVQRMAGSLTDITEGKVADALTRLPNRNLFLERLRRCVGRFQRDEIPFAVLYLDLDNFKLINDCYGHEAGDQLLIAVARRLEGSVRTNDSLVARLGGDEFAVLLDCVDCERSSTAVAARVLDAVAAPFALGAGREVFSSLSIGISSPSAKNQAAEDILREADTAMYAAKTAGKSSFQVFDPSMQETVARRLKIENELRHAIERAEFTLHFQTIVDLKTRRPIGLEALVRWRHPQRGLVLPGEFIPVAEETGLINPIGGYVLNEACRQLVEWQSRLHLTEPIFVSVNVSARQLADSNLVQNVVRALSETGLPPNGLRLEVTETAIMERPDEGIQWLRELRALGVKIGIDDFGTGYSSLASLHRLPLDLLKVDRSFVNKMVQSQENQAIVRTILTLAQGLDLDVVAEGIENEPQRQLLSTMGCQFGQGFYFSRPLEADQIEAILALELK